MSAPIATVVVPRDRFNVANLINIVISFYLDSLLRDKGDRGMSISTSITALLQSLYLQRTT